MKVKFHQWLSNKENENPTCYGDDILLKDIIRVSPVCNGDEELLYLFVSTKDSGDIVSPTNPSFYKLLNHKLCRKEPGVIS